jgi:hypothetical protein
MLFNLPNRQKQNPQQHKGRSNNITQDPASTPPLSIPTKKQATMEAVREREPLRQQQQQQ